MVKDTERTWNFRHARYDSPPNMIHPENLTSGIGWVDFSSEHREKVKTVLDLLATPGVVDELGIGVIRDSFSDALFPGISTIQTRAKYFVTLPRIFEDYERLPTNERRRTPLAAFLKQEENNCMKRLNANHANDSPPARGIIGATFAGKQGEVQRKPSSVYWNGLRTFGLIKTTLSLQEFLRTFARADAQLQDLIQGTDETKGDDLDALGTNGSIFSAAPYVEDWQEHLTLHLSFDEADALAHQIKTKVPISLLGQILADDDLRQAFVDAKELKTFDDFGESPLFTYKSSDELKVVLMGAKHFSQIIKGAHLRYNVLLQQRYGTADKFEEQWERWLEDVSHFPWGSWDTQLLWSLASQHHRQIQGFTKKFVQDWIEQVQRSAPDVAALDALVIKQEGYNKKARARLRQNSDQSVSGWVGLDSLDYRYSQARTIIEDIHIGLQRPA